MGILGAVVLHLFNSMTTHVCCNELFYVSGQRGGIPLSAVTASDQESVTGTVTTSVQWECV
jgi:hypothetical protein